MLTAEEACGLKISVTGVYGFRRVDQVGYRSLRSIYRILCFQPILLVSH